MPWRPTVIATCLASLFLAESGRGAVSVGQTTSRDDAPRSAQPSPVAAEFPIRLAEQAQHPSPPAANAPPPLPANYRLSIAMSIARAHLLEGKGPAEISNVYSNSGLTAAATTVCVHYPLAVPGLLTADSGRRRMLPIEFFAVRGMFSGEVSYKRRLAAAPCPGAMKPFVELNQIAQTLQTCRANGQARCAVHGHIIDIPARLLNAAKPAAR